jgi:hypothetical protein
MLTICDVLRGCLFAEGVPLVCDAGDGHPGLAGERSKQLVLSVYSCYAGESIDGEYRVMRVKDFTRLLEDMKILRTHANCDDFGNASRKSRRKLGAISLLHGIVLDEKEEWLSEDTQNRELSFCHFLQALENLSAVVYPSEDRVHALDAILHESVCPLHAWRCIIGIPQSNVDPVLVLLLHAYGPNLWQAFLKFAVDKRQRAVPQDLQYPQDCSAHEAEHCRRIGLKYWTGAMKRKSQVLGIPMNGLVRFGYNFSLCPDLITEKGLRSIASQVMGDTNTASTGALSFCEWLGVLVRIAEEGIGGNPNLGRNLFPTLHAQVLALLSVWGVACPERLREIESLAPPSRRIKKRPQAGDSVHGIAFA